MFRHVCLVFNSARAPMHCLLVCSKGAKARTRGHRCNRLRCLHEVLGLNNDWIEEQLMRMLIFSRSFSVSIMTKASNRSVAGGEKKAIKAKAPSATMGGDKKMKRKKKRKESYNIYIYKVLKQVSFITPIQTTPLLLQHSPEIRPFTLYAFFCSPNFFFLKDKPVFHARLIINIHRSTPTPKSSE